MFYTTCQLVVSKKQVDSRTDYFLSLYWRKNMVETWVLHCRKNALVIRRRKAEIKAYFERTRTSNSAWDFEQYISRCELY